MMPGVPFSLFQAVIASLPPAKWKLTYVLHSVIINKT